MPSSGGRALLQDWLVQWLVRFDTPHFLAAELLLLVVTLACFSLAQNDTYWHLAAGRRMAETGRVMLTDEFSHTNFGAPWLNYEWLTQVTFFQVYRLGGMPFLTGVCGALAAGSLIMAWRLIRGPTEHRLVLLALTLPLVTPGWSLRPQAFSMCFMMAAVHVVLRQRFLWLPVLFLLWANFHGAVALGFVVLGGDLLAAAMAGSGVLKRASFAVLSFGATILTPLGPALWPEVWRSVHRSPANQISEWLRPTFTADFAVF
jgi:hypothetical protein